MINAIVFARVVHCRALAVVRDWRYHIC